jgi:CRISPR type I-E-associated protein CasB/Cse2
MSDRRKAEDLAAEWWQEMSFERSGGGLLRTGGAKRAALARLRRAAGPIDALAVPETIDLYRRLRGVDRGAAPDFPDRVAAVAVALASLRPELENLRPDRRVPRVFARKSFDDPDSAVLSEARFRRLLQADGVELLDAFRRLVRLLDGRAEPASLADAILHWDDRMRQRWIFEYYGVAIATPHPGAAPAAPTAP